MSIPSYPEEMMPDLIKTVTASSDRITLIHLCTCHFRKCDDYNSVVAYLVNIFSTTVIAAKETHNRDVELFDIRVDMDNTKFKDMDLSFLKHLLKTLTTMFPGTVRRCEIYDAPAFFRPIYVVLKYILPKRSRDRVYFMD